jgi:hypothetical protein
MPSVSWDHMVVMPCNYALLCALSGRMPNPFLLAVSPPADDECRHSYCMDAHDVPYPVLVTLRPTIAVSNGGTSIVAVLSRFPALSLQDVQVS